MLDARFPGLKLVRPLRNVTNSEVEFLSGRPPCIRYGASAASRFVDSLTRDGYPGTVSTVLSVASKVRAVLAEDAGRGGLAAEPGRPGRACWLCCMPPAGEQDTCRPCELLLRQAPFRTRQKLLERLNHGTVVDE